MCRLQRPALLLSVLSVSARQPAGLSGVALDTELVALSGFKTALTLGLPPTDPNGQPWPLKIDARVLDWDGSDRLGRASFDPYVSHNASLDGRALSQTVQLELQSPHVWYTRLEVQLSTTSGELLWTNRAAGAAPLELWSIPPALSLIPCTAAVVLALLLRQVLVALFVALWLGATVANGLDPLTGALRTVDSYLAGAIGGGSHPLIIVFTLLLGGMIAVIRASGGAAGIAKLATGVAKKPEHVLLASYAGHLQRHRSHRDAVTRTRCLTQRRQPFHQVRTGSGRRLRRLRLHPHHRLGDAARRQRARRPPAAPRLGAARRRRLRSLAPPALLVVRSAAGLHLAAGV
jgi:hypothetical protein